MTPQWLNALVVGRDSRNHFVHVPWSIPLTGVYVTRTDGVDASFSTSDNSGYGSDLGDIGEMKMRALVAERWAAPWSRLMYDRLGGWGCGRGNGDGTGAA